jgi:hypothetical protein
LARLDGKVYLFLFSDGLKYVVKFYNTKGRTKEVVNEYVVGKLAEHLSLLPVVPLKLVYMPADQDIIKNVPRRVKSKVYKPGYQFATLFIDNSTEFSEMVTPPTKDNLKNRNLLAGLIVFDRWVNNNDRTMSNILIQSLQGDYYFHMIDQGKCFPGGYNWTAETLKQNVIPLIERPVYKWATSLLSSEDEFKPFIDQITAFNHKSINEIIQSIPDNWYVSDEEKQALLDFLIKQQESLPNVMEMYINQYRYLITDQS